jgi:predicted enzyme related to lactoylglutathione lyase
MIRSGMNRGVEVKPTHLVLDCTDLERTAQFWSALLDLPITRKESDWVDLDRLTSSGPVLAFQLVPEGKSGKNRLHLDLEVSDFAAAKRLASSLGGRPASAVFGLDAPWQVWQDPEGNEFCLISAN